MIVLKSKPAFLSSLAGALLSAAGVQAVGLYEAENAAYVHGSVKTDANASGGEYLDGNGDFNVTWTVDAEGGDYNLSFNIKVPSGDRTMGVFVNSNQVGTVNSISRTWEEVAVAAVLADGINTIELRDSEDTAEFDVDYVFVAKVTTFSYEAEDMVLSGFGIQSNDIASGSHFIQLSGITGTATQVFSGHAGEYYVDTYYMDETDGVCSYELYVDGELTDSWLADGDFGTAGVSEASQTSHRSSGVEMQSGSEFLLRVIKGGAEFGRTDVIVFTYIEEFLTEAENMTLDGYAVETNSAANGGLLAVLEGEQGSVSETLAGLSSGFYDLSVFYFDETDGEGVFKVYLNDQLVDAWEADRKLGSSDAVGINRIGHTVKNLYLRSGDKIEICGFADGGEPCRIDAYNLQTTDASSSVSMDWNFNGYIESLILGGSEHLDAPVEEGVIFRIFDGYSIDTLEQTAAGQEGSLLILNEDGLDYARFYFRLDAYDHHLMIRLIGFDGVPRNDPSLSIRMNIPYLSTLGFQLMDSAVSADDSGSELELDWNQLSERGLLAGGRIALYATADAAAALDEIAQVHTDNGNLDAYYAWIDGFPIIGTDADLFADPDGDGINNLSEYALGGVPTIGSRIELPMPGKNGSDLEVYYNRRLDAEARGLTYTLHRTDDLMDPNWNTNGVSETGVEAVDAEFESVTNRVATVGKTHQFLKLDIGIEK